MDAELFLVLPRIVWLCFLADPSKSVEFLKHLLPHRFEECSVWTDGSHTLVVGGELRRSHSTPGLFVAPEGEAIWHKIEAYAGAGVQELGEKFWRVEAKLEHA